MAYGASNHDICYLFSYFKGGGQDGLHLACSEDGFHWTPLKNDLSFLKPAVGGKLMRDPSILRGPDDVFHLACTTSWGDRGIGMAHSRDLVNWSEQDFLPVMAHEPAAMNCWAPEIFYDEKSGEYIIFWATTIPGRFPQTDQTGINVPAHVGAAPGRYNHRIYCTTTRDFHSFSPTRLFYDDGFNVIDATMIRNGDTYYLFMKDESIYPVRRGCLRIATAGNPQGPFGHASQPIPIVEVQGRPSPFGYTTATNVADAVEGPSAVKIGAAWVVFYDEYNTGHYGAVMSEDMQKWRCISNVISFPEGARHGTVFTAPRPILTALQKAYI